MAVLLPEIAGKEVKQYNLTANGFVQKLSVDLHEPGFANGLYLLEATIGNRRQSFRLVKQ